MLYTYLRIGEAGYAAAIATCAFSCFAGIVYIYFLLIYPKLYNQNRILFFISIILLLLVTSLVRIYVETHFISKLYSRPSFFNNSIAHVSYVVVTNFVAFVLAILLKHVSISFVVMKKQEEMERKQLMTEMKLLKAQLQPHFLFNSLNNIYYEAYKESPKAALLIEKLSQIMRFFLEINTKEKIPLETEISFIKNVIDLEQIRCHNPVHVEINNSAEPGIYVPPMLMVPLVENALKHGIDKRSSNNYIFIDIRITSQNISFFIKNQLHSTLDKNSLSGTGLKNLKERLVLLYSDNHKLQTAEQENNFTATLIIPRK
ncbi:sensor histidine kinase [Chryseobacterium angstadtii]|uniref:sensor histidine kinase n=1 Tax=Chryseobacterium angstadtii TaxID=558151 RepID=UPI0012FEFA03|nr:histidine kinase [Chryseobacterium angstadtii]